MKHLLLSKDLPIKRNYIEDECGDWANKRNLSFSQSAHFVYHNSSGTEPAH